MNMSISKTMSKNEMACASIAAFLEDEIAYQKRRAARAERNMHKSKRSTMFLLLASITAIATGMLILVICIILSGMSCRETEVVDFSFAYASELPEENQVFVQEGTVDSLTDIVVPAAVETPEYVVSFTSDERKLFEQVMAAESYSFWSYNDVLSLATVVMNRIKNPAYPDNIYDVLTQDRQFSTYFNGSYKTAQVTQECRQAVEDALMGKTNLNRDVLWFCTKQYYDACPQNDFFRTISHVYTCRNVYFFED